VIIKILKKSNTMPNKNSIQ